MPLTSDLPSKNPSALPVEEVARLDSYDLTSLLNIEAQSSSDQARALQTLQRGIHHLRRANPTTAGLHRMEQEACDAFHQVSAQAQRARTAQRSPTCAAALTQPASNLSLDAHKALLECWGLIVFAHWSSSRPIPELLSSGWRKLAEARLPGWRELARQPLDQFSGPDAATTPPGPQVVRDFLDALNELGVNVSFNQVPDRAARQLIAPEPVAHSPLHADDRMPRPVSPTDDRPEPRPWPTAAAPTAETEEIVKDVEGRFIGWQLVRARYLAPLDGFALPLRWEALHPTELIRCGTRLAVELNNIDPTTRLAAATCLMTLFSGLPLQLIFQQRFHEHGDTWIDLKRSCLMRDLGAIAVRKDKLEATGKVPAWRSICLPPSVVRVIDEALTTDEMTQPFGAILGRLNIDLSRLRNMMNEGDTTSHRPELSRLSGSLGLFLVDAGINPTLAAQASGDWSLCPTADHFYLLADDRIFVDIIGVACRAVGLEAPHDLPAPKEVGSPYYRRPEQLAEIFRIQRSEIIKDRARLPNRSRVADYIEFQNSYQQACAQLFVTTTGHRGSRLPEMAWTHVDLDHALALICDKENDEYSARRLDPLTAVVTQTLKHLLVHQQAVVAHLAKTQDNGQIKLNVDALGKMQSHIFFQVLRNKHTGRYYTAPIATDHLAKALEPRATLPINFGRHFGFTELVKRGTSGMAVNAWTGRHTMGSEPFGMVSSLSPLEACNYMRGELEAIFEPLLLKPLVGLGSTRDRDLLPPPPTPVYTIKPPVNDFLEAKLAAQDLNPHVVIHAQRCPFPELTLSAYRYVSFLRAAFLKGHWKDVDPEAVLAVSLVLFDCVLTVGELDALSIAAVSKPLRINEVVIAEHHEEGVIKASRPLTRVSTACCARLRILGPTVRQEPVSDAIGQFLQRLDPAFDRSQIDDPVTWLMTLTMHWALITTAPTEHFALFATARSLSASDVARYVHRRPAKDALPPFAALRTRKFRGLKELVAYARHFADKTQRLGEHQRRRKGLARAASLLQSTVPGEEGGLYWACAWIISECLDPVSNQIKTGTMYTYLNILLPVFEGGVQFVDYDTDDWMSMRQMLIERRAQSDPGDVNGALLHLASFARSLGYFVPAQLWRAKRGEAVAPLRQPVVVFEHEIDVACKYIDSGQDAWKSLAIAKLQFMARVGTRPIEAANISVADLASDGALVHVTTAGFDHLKTSTSRGSVDIRNPVLQQLLLETLRLQCAATPAGQQPLLFRIEGHDDTAKMDADIVRALRFATGESRLTLRDLRASAATHSACNLPDLLHELTSGLTCEVRPATGMEISDKGRSMALAIRRARHSITYPTTQQHYDTGSSIRLAVALRRQESMLEIGSSFLAWATGKTTGAIDVARHIKGIAISDTIESWTLLQQLIRPHLFAIPEPEFRAAVTGSERLLTAPNTQDTGWAALLHWYGIDTQTISHLTGVRASALESTLRSIETTSGPITPDIRDSLAGHFPAVLNSSIALEFWHRLINSRHDIWSIRTPSSSACAGSRTPSFSSLLRVRVAAEFLVSCMPPAWRVTVLGPKSIPLDQKASIRDAFQKIRIGFFTRANQRDNTWRVVVGGAGDQGMAPRTVGQISTFVFRAATVAAHSDN